MMPQSVEDNGDHLPAEPQDTTDKDREMATDPDALQPLEEKDELVSDITRTISSPASVPLVGVVSHKWIMVALSCSVIGRVVQSWEELADQWPEKPGVMVSALLVSWRSSLVLPLHCQRAVLEPRYGARILVYTSAHHCMHAHSLGTGIYLPYLVFADSSNLSKHQWVVAEHFQNIVKVSAWSTAELEVTQGNALQQWKLTVFSYGDNVTQFAAFLLCPPQSLTSTIRSHTPPTPTANLSVDPVITCSTGSARRNVSLVLDSFVRSAYSMCHGLLSLWVREVCSNHGQKWLWMSKENSWLPSDCRQTSFPLTGWLLH